MPVGRLASLAGLIPPDAVGRKAEVRDAHTVRSEVHLGHRAHVADQLDSIDGVVGCHSWCLSLCGPLVAARAC